MKTTRRIEKLKEFLGYTLDDIKEYLRTKYRNIKCFFIWGWRLREQRYWDSSYLYIVMFYQLDSMIKEFEDVCCNKKYSPYVGMEKHIRQMRTCKALLAREFDTADVYSEYPVWMRHKRTWEERHDMDIPDCFMKSTETPQEFALTKRQWDFEAARKASDREYLYRLLSKYSDRWWW